jgi:4-aminobutyrate aminotransferase-like enzyme
VCCAAALAVLDVIHDENLLGSVEQKGKRIESAISHPAIREIRRAGLMFAVDFDSEDRVQRIVQYALDRGVICFWFLSHPASFRLAPPLTITDAEIDEACAIIREAIDRS